MLLFMFVLPLLIHAPALSGIDDLDDNPSLGSVLGNAWNLPVDWHVLVDYELESSFDIDRIHAWSHSLTGKITHTDVVKHGCAQPTFLFEPRRTELMSQDGSMGEVSSGVAGNRNDLSPKPGPETCAYGNITSYGSVKAHPDAAVMPKTTNAEIFDLFSDPSGVFLAWAQTPKKPGAPTGLTATPGDASVTLSWTAPTDIGGAAITDYQVRYRTVPGNTWTEMNIGSTATTYTVTGLTNGQEYRFAVKALNPTESVNSDRVDTTPRTVPGAPTGLTATPDNTEVSLSWTAPADNGGTAITDYIVEYRAGNSNSWSTFADGTSTATTATVTGLTNGTEYQFRVKATNVAGNSVASATATTTPRTVPGAPTGLTATPGNVSVSLSWTAPSTGGAAISDYIVEYKAASASNWATFNDGTSTSTTATVTGLTNGTEYDFRVKATNVAGNSAASATASATPSVPPGAPTGLTATPGNAQASLSWTAPTSTGGAAISDYIVEYKAASASNWATFNDGTSTSTTATVTGLTNGTEYDFRVKATNVAGNSVASATATTTPRTVPGAPTGLTATPGNVSVSLSWTAPSTGGAAISDYIVEYKAASASNWATFNDGTSTSTTATVTGLTNGTEYDFRVKATNVAGNSAASATASATPSVPPGAPTGLTATPGNAQASLSWTAPTSTGGAAISDYIVEYKAASASQWSTFADGTRTSTTATVTGLTNGTEYDFRVKATNVAGNSAASATATTTPRTVPDAPTSLTATPDDTEVSLSWTAPADNGGAAITDYIVEYKAASALQWSTFADGTRTSTTATVTGLTNGTEYDFRVKVTNVAGNSAASATATTTPRTVPDAPTSLTATPDDTEVSLSWTAPADNGGAAITDYIVEYKAASASQWSTFADGTRTSTTATVTGLTNGTEYDFRVKATNVAGNSAASATATTTPRTVPDAPTSLTATPDDTEVSLSWTAPADNGGAAITDYIVEYKAASASQWSTFADGTRTSTTATVTGLTNGTEYDFRVKATNVAGNSAASATATTTPRTVPDAPTGLTATAGNTWVDLSWTAPTDNGGAAITDYKIQYRAGATGAWTTFNDGTGTTTSTTVTSLTNKTAYQFQILAVNIAGDSAPSNTVTSTPIPIPSAPRNLKATADSAKVALAWAVPADRAGLNISDYKVEYKATSASAWITFGDGFHSAPSAFVTGLTNGITYEFRVSAINSEGIGPVSSVVSATPTSSAGPPSDLTATPGITEVSLSWTAPTDTGGNTILDYVVEYRAGTAAAWIKFADGTGTTTSATVTGLKNGIEHYFRVSAVTFEGTGAASAIVSTTPRTVPDAPTDLILIPGDASMELLWTKPFSGGTAITDYKIEYRAGTTGTWTTFTDGTSTATTATVTGLTNGTEYYFRVSATNIVGTGDPSGLVSDRPRPAPGAPTGLTATSGNNDVSLSWTAPAGVNGIGIIQNILEYRPANGQWKQVFVENVTSATVTGLTNGIVYEFRVKALNNIGIGPASNVVSATPSEPPGAPTGLTATPGNARVSLSWTAPTDTGGSEITDYVVQHRLKSDIIWVTLNDGTGTTPSATVTGLQNGSEYVFRVWAVYGESLGPMSGSVLATPSAPASAPPGPPLTLTVISGNTQASLSWTAPTSTGGAAITDYIIEYKAASASQWSTFADGTSTATTAIVTGLTNGTDYQFRVSAVNSVGTGSPSGTVQTRPSAPLGAPTGLTATPGNARVSLSWTAPRDTGGQGINKYVVEYRATTATAWTTSTNTTATTSITVTGLTNGTEYVFRVKAEFGGSLGPASATATATPMIPNSALPGAPTGLTATPGNARASLSWTAPTSTGNSAITDYAIQYKAATATVWTTFTDGTSTATTATVTGLTNGTEYDFRIRATNSDGTGSPSVIASTTPRTVSGAPTGLTATPDDTEVSLSWTAPADNGGAAITDYIVEYKAASASQWSTFADGTSTATTAIVTGLTNGTEYDFRVKATNVAGNGAASATASATPSVPPGAPTGLTSTSGDTEVSLSWTAPTSTGGAAITDYTIQYKTASATTWTTFNDGTSTSTTTTVTGLTNDTAYQFRIIAVNSVGPSAPSGVITATPSTQTSALPGAPTGLAATPGNARVSLSWTAPSNTGGAAITDYIVEYSAGTTGVWTTFNDGIGTTTSVTVTGLTNGTTYQFRISAVNSVGTGTSSGVVSSTPTAPIIIPPPPSLTISSAPGNLAATPGNAQVSLSWTVPSDTGGTAITDYIVEYRAGNSNSWSTFADGTSTATTATVTGLTNGTEYQFRIKAVNSVGDSSASRVALATPGTVPGAPADLEAIFAFASIFLTWTAPADPGSTAITDYIVEYRTDINEWIVFPDGESTATTGIVTGLIPGIEYQFRIKAVNVVGPSPPSEIISATPSIPPDSPTDLIATPGNTEVTLSWNEPADHGGSALLDYLIQYRTSADTEWTVFPDEVSDVQSATVTGLTNGIEYQFQISSINVVGVGPESEIVSATPLPVTDAPDNLVAEPSNTNVSLSWNISATGGAAILDYIIEYKTPIDTEWTVFPDEVSDVQSATVTGLTNGIEYQFRIKAVNVVGPSPPSEIISATPRTVSGMPVDPVVTPGNTIVLLSWTAPTDNGGAAIFDYIIEHKTPVDTEWTVFPDEVSDVQSATVTGLTNGAVYEFRIAAVNAAGNSSPTRVISATPLPVPDMPTGMTAIPRDTEVSLLWTAPTGTGSTAITDYIIQYKEAGATVWTTFVDGTGTGTTTTVTGLTNGIEYQFRISAVSSTGTGIPSEIISAIPILIPSLPTDLAATPGNTIVLLSWTAPTDDGGAAITDYIIQYKETGAIAWTTFVDGTGTGTTTTVTGLTNGTEYEFRIAAVNAAGNSSPTRVISATPLPVSDMPTGLTAIPRDTEVSLLWTAPTGTGGAAITDYTVEYWEASASQWSTFDDGTGTGTATTVTGLTNGIEYQFRISAVSSTGTGIPSEIISAIPITIPSIPTDLAATPGNTIVLLSWTAPTDDGGAAITDYIIQYKTPVDTEWTVFQDEVSNAQFATVTGLTNGTEYEFRIAAVNAAGNSSPTGAISATPLPVPDMPTGLTAIPSDTEVSLLWTAPADTGDSAITDYAVEYWEASASQWSTFDDGTGTGTATTVTGLTNGIEYQFRISAVSSTGTGIPSEIISAIPRTVSGMPVDPVVTPGNTIVLLSWTAPTDDGGAAITDYIIQYKTPVDTEWTVFQDEVSNAQFATVTGLTNGTEYEFRIAAVNAAGNSSPTGAISATPLPVPDMPTGLTAIPSDTEVSLLWTAPADTGDSAITDYAVEYWEASASQWSTFDDGTGTGTATTVTGLTNGIEYQFRISAVSSTGTGIPSEIISAIPITIPSIPTDLAATPGNTIVLLSWTAPTDDGGAAITDYIIQYKEAGAIAWTTFVDGTGTGTTATVTGLTNGAVYEFRTSATNAAGTGDFSSPTTISLSGTVGHVTLHVSAYVDSNGDGVRDPGEESYSGMHVLTYSVMSGDVDLLFTGQDITTKSDLLPETFYAIALLPEDHTATTHILDLDGIMSAGVLHVVDPQPGSIHSMDIGIMQDP